MTWKPKVIIASLVVIASIVMTSLGFNTYIQSIGWLAAGYLFGSSQPTTK